MLMVLRTHGRGSIEEITIRHFKRIRLFFFLAQQIQCGDVNR
jgi:hypothetical protein